VHAERLAADLPQLARYVKVDGSGHMTPLERPETVNELLAELSATPATVAA
jgi:pimeloyl-ACP methyl ester carboxylesterase